MNETKMSTDKIFCVYEMYLNIYLSKVIGKSFFVYWFLSFSKTHMKLNAYDFIACCICYRPKLHVDMRAEAHWIK